MSQCKSDLCRKGSSSDEVAEALQAVLKLRLVAALNEEDVVFCLDDEGAKDGVGGQETDELLVGGRQRIDVIIAGIQ